MQRFVALLCLTSLLISLAAAVEIVPTIKHFTVKSFNRNTNASSPPYLTLIGHDGLYFSSNDGQVAQIEKNGKHDVNWVKQITPKGKHRSCSRYGVAAPYNRSEFPIVFCTDLYLISTQKGEVEWLRPGFGDEWMLLASTHYELIFGDVIARASIAAFNVEDGSVKWNLTIPNRANRPQYIGASVVDIDEDDRAAFVLAWTALEADNLFRLSLATGEVLWTSTIRAFHFSPTCYCPPHKILITIAQNFSNAVDNMHLVAINATDGSVVWMYDFGDCPQGRYNLCPDFRRTKSLTCWGSTVFLTASAVAANHSQHAFRYHVLAFDILSGKKSWESKDYFTNLFLEQPMLIYRGANEKEVVLSCQESDCAGAKHNVTGVSVKSGKELWAWDPPCTFNETKLFIDNTEGKKGYHYVAIMGEDKTDVYTFRPGKKEEDDDVSDLIRSSSDVI